MAVARTPFDSLRLSDFEMRRLGWAFAVSLALHLLSWGGYELGREFNLWQRLHWPAWLPVAKWIQPPQPTPIVQVSEPLVFVDVSPAQAATEAPKDAKFYSDKNSRAANPDADKDSNQPKLNGRQTNVPRTEDVKRPDYNKLQPGPPAQTESPPRPVLGDLTLLRPEDLQRPKPEERPRTLKQVGAQEPRLAGQQMKQSGGVKRHLEISSFDVKATQFGAYDRAIFEAIQQYWYNELDTQHFAWDRVGRVTVRFHLNYDGSVTDMEVLNTNVGELLCYVCQAAVTGSAPFARWPDDMRRMVGRNYREITLTFFYE